MLCFYVVVKKQKEFGNPVSASLGPAFLQLLQRSCEVWDVELFETQGHPVVTLQTLVMDT